MVYNQINIRIVKRKICPTVVRTIIDKIYKFVYLDWSRLLGLLRIHCRVLYTSQTYFIGIFTVNYTGKFSYSNVLNLAFTIGLCPVFMVILFLAPHL